MIGAWAGGILVGLMTGAVAGAWFANQTIPRWLARWSLPRETRQERLRRRCRTAVFEAEDLLEGWYPQLALRPARRACRFNPANPNAIYVLGMAYGARRRYELALKHVEQAYNAIQHQAGPHDDKTVDCIPTFAVQAARFCARIRLESTSELERDSLAEQVLEWAAIAMESDPDEAACLMDDPLLRELRTQIRLMPTCTNQV